MAAEIATPRALVIARPGNCADRTKGYLRQKDLVGLVEAMGFELVAASEINTNPRDARDHAAGVWEMKPNWSTKRAELEHLGETDDAAIPQALSRRSDRGENKAASARR